MSVQDPQVSRTKSKVDQFSPKLRKNQKLELRWGNDYYEAVNKAVFSRDNSPYMPAEPPVSIKEDVDKTGYVCKQCKDCFRFLSSIEEHTLRRSWILGYWCQSCFTTKCTHVAGNEPICSSCRNMRTSKDAYLPGKSVKRNLKKGSIRVFYNQCQFFAHLRMHGIIMVDLSEIMLMPLPSGIQREDYGQLDKLCKALMEAMFRRRTHVLDWLREMKIQPDHWKILLDWMESKKKNPLTDILSRYSEDCLKEIDLEEKTKRDRLARRVNPRKKMSYTMDLNNSYINEKDPLADNDDSPNDIAFVDCGPTPSQAVIQEFSDANVSKEIVKDRANSLWHSFSQQYKKQKEKSRQVEKKKNDESVAESSESLANINRNAAPRLLTIRSPKSLNLSTIMKHLPIDGINGKNIIVVTDDSEGENSVSSMSDSPTINEPSPAIESKTIKKSLNTPMAPVKTKETKVNIKMNPATKFVNIRPKSQSFSEQMSLHGRIVFQNGRKYIIRHVPKSKTQSLLQDSIVKKLRTPPPLLAPISNPNIPILPKPIPITTIAPIAAPMYPIDRLTKPTARVPKRASKMKTPSGFSLTAIKANLTSQNSKARISKIQKALLIKCRESLMIDLLRSSKRELENYVKHVKEINEVYAKTMNFQSDSVLSNNAKAIECFENAAKSSPITEHSGQESCDYDIYEINARKWEIQMKDGERLRNCEICSKMVKPTSYIVGISNRANDETIYCQCYNNICYICSANQGSLIQLKTHVKWHKGEKPYTCPSCSIVFPTSVELEIHVWTSCFHPMARYIYGCGVCEIEGILDMESIARHFLLLHTRRKVICTECKMEYPTGSQTCNDYTRHFIEHHRDAEKITEPKRLFVCNLKHCIIRPELFGAHLSDHIGVLRWIYYKCPFCPTITQGSERNKSLMREHLIEIHLDRISEIVSSDALGRILDGIKLTPISVSTIAEGTEQICQVLNADPSGPKILDARTITPATFEFGTEICEESNPAGHSKLPRILEVRSEAVDEFESSETKTNDFEIEILSVKSVTENSVESLSAIENDVSNLTTRGNSDDLTTCNSFFEQIECEDSSNSHEEITIASLNSKADDSELESYGNQDVSDVAKDYTSDSNFEEPSTSKGVPPRPWRIALNNPTDVEIEPVVYNCHLCGELINTSWPIVKNHFDVHHSSEYEIFTVSPNIPRVRINSINDTDCQRSADVNEKKRKIEIVSSSGPKRRRRWGPKKYIERSGSPNLGICVKQEHVQEIEGSFRCKKCDCLFDDRSLLRDHIAMQHRIKGQYLICLECGENFVVVPSLQMHLKALHGIEDPITYLTKNTAYAPEILDDTEEDEKATESNQCYVCMAVFEDKSAVDKHMRVHGMAFLRRKRFEAQRALKSCPKINNCTNDAPKPVDRDEKSTNIGNVVSWIKKDVDQRDDRVNHANDDKSSKDQIQENKTITNIQKIEPLV